MSDPPDGFNTIVVGQEIAHIFDEKIAELFNEVGNNPITMLSDMINNTLTMTKSAITNQKVQDLLKPGVKFDLVISEIMMNEAVLGFSEHFGCPHILISTVGATSWVDKITNNPSPLSYVPSFLLDTTDRMNLLRRLQNTLLYVTEQVFMELFYYPKQKEIYETAFPNSKSFKPFWEKMKRGSSLVLLNSHFSISYPRPYLPNLVNLSIYSLIRNQSFIDIFSLD